MTISDIIPDSRLKGIWDIRTEIEVRVMRNA